MAMSGTTPDPPPTSTAGEAPSQTNQRPIGPLISSSSPTTTSSCRNDETSPSSRRSTVNSISLEPSGARRDRVRTRTPSSRQERSGEARNAGRRGDETARASARRKVLARAVSGRIAMTMASARGCASRSVRLSAAVTQSPCVALLQPGVATVVVAVALPKAWLVMVEHPQARYPLRALPEVKVGHQQTRRAAVSDGQGFAFEIPDHPGLPTGHVRQWQVRRITGVREREHVGRTWLDACRRRAGCRPTHR